MKKIKKVILPRSSAERKSCFFVSKRSKHTWNQELSEMRDRVSEMRVMRVFENAQTVVSNCREVFQLSCLHAKRAARRKSLQIVTFRHLISSTARPVASLISSKSIPSYGSGILVLD